MVDPVDERVPLDRRFEPAEALKLFLLMWVCVEVMDANWRPRSSFVGEPVYRYSDIAPMSAFTGCSCIACQASSLINSLPSHLPPADIMAAIFARPPAEQVALAEGVSPLAKPGSLKNPIPVIPVKGGGVPALRLLIMLGTMRMRRPSIWKILCTIRLPRNRGIRLCNNT